ncbi:MAG: YbaB/EbfC family nucleoid-associated protein [Chitinophagales bacterium]|jgi:DNA-binding YbaB/EbfC family protein|nr:YbaB/EbfC family nucleoid-associated protein [Sphingobacteriales bacterium]MBP7534660.1 YbaB/EbfC family nucleoid-associated protein [Chitinophagales bacterium]
MFDMFGKLQEMQQQMEATKKRLDTMTVIGDAEGVTVTANGNRHIVNISINPDVVDPNDLEQLEDLLMVAVNRAIEQAEALNAAENAKIASGMLPPGMDIPGLF